MFPTRRVGAIAALGLLMLQGCTAGQRDRVERRIEAAEDLQETLAKVDQAVFCSMTVTALTRVYTVEERVIIIGICEPEDGP